MGNCRTPGPTCAERGGGISAPATGEGSGRDARPVGVAEATPAGVILEGWPRLIRWDEFDGRDRRPQGVDEDAQVASTLERPDDVSVVRQDGRFRVGPMTARLVVEKDNSWVVTSAKSAALLAHEQGHYDITGLVARDLVDTLNRLRARSPRELGRAVLDAFQEADTLAKRLSQLYDTQTRNGTNAAVQQKWEQHLRDAADGPHRLTSGPRL
jgi:hypothetical protein